MPERSRLVKIVRDKVAGYLGIDQRVSYAEVNEDEYLLGLRKKLMEEATEYVIDPTAAELADLLEVAMALAVHDLRCGWDHIEWLRLRKRETHGAFDERVAMFVQTTEVLGA